MAYFRAGSSKPGIEFLWKTSDLIANTYINNTTGEEEAYNNWYATPYIDVTPNEVLAYAGANGADYCAWYDADKNFISKFATFPLGYGHKTVPANAYYMRISEQDTYIEHTQFWRE